MTTEVRPKPSTEVRKKLHTVEEFMRMADNGKRYELIEGELVEMPGPNVSHGKIITKLFGKLHEFLAAKSVGQVLTNMAYELGPKTAPIPDLAFVRTERLVGIDDSKAFPGPPDIAIEVMSPTDTWFKVIKKVQLYQQAGTKAVWVIDPFDQGVFVYYLNQTRKSLLHDDELSSKDSIPGFKMKVGELFEG